MEAIKSWPRRTIGSNYEADIDGSITIQSGREWGENTFCPGFQTLKGMSFVFPGCMSERGV